MAQQEFEGFDAGRISILLRSKRWVNLIGAATSVALVFGVGWWGYKLAVRDMRGVPVIASQEGPMRVAPENPGGVIAEHQGLSVNQVAAIGTTAELADRLVLAPRPVGLSDEDAAGTLVALAAPVSGRSAFAAGVLVVDPEVTAAPAQVAQSSISEDIEQLVQTLSSGEAPLTPLEPVVSGPKTVLPKGAVFSDVRPRARPAQGGETIVVAAATAVREGDGTDLAAGTRLVQLGAYDSPEAARQDWDKIASALGELMVGRTRIVQSAVSGGRTFYRLRTDGFTEEAEQRRFCSAVLPSHNACIPVTLR